MATLPGDHDQVDVLIRRLDPELPLPAYAHPGDAGVDLVTATDLDLAPGERMLVPTGIAIALPEGYAAFVHPRSGLAARFGLGIVNAPGTVDAGYRGEVSVLVINHDRRQRLRLSRGDRIAQLVVQRVEQARFHEVELLPGSARGEGGYGSTGGFLDEAVSAEPPVPDLPVPDPPVPASPAPNTSVRDQPPGPSEEAEPEMSLFRRAKSPTRSDEYGKQSGERDEPTTWAEEGEDSGDAGVEAGSENGGASDGTASEDQLHAQVAGLPTRANGPWDISEVPDPAAGSRINLGGLWIPAHEDVEIRVEADPESGAVVSVTVVHEDSALQISPFAAPRTDGIWADVRAEMAAGLTQQGGTADMVDGPVGVELRAKVPVRAADGSARVEAARFIGVDGPRWFLRGAFTGRAAAESSADAVLLDVFCDVVVVRGSTPMAPREPIPLVLPEAAQRADGAQEEEDLQPFVRGPEITEVR